MPDFAYILRSMYILPPEYYIYNMSSYLFTSSADAVHFLVVAATILMATTPIALTCPPLPPSSRYRDNALAATLLPEGSTVTVGMCRLSTGQCLDPLAQFTPEQGRGEEEVRHARPLQNVHLSTFTFCARKRGRKRRKEEKKRKKKNIHTHIHAHALAHTHARTFTCTLTRTHTHQGSFYWNVSTRHLCLGPFVLAALPQLLRAVAIVPTKRVKRLSRMDFGTSIIISRSDRHGCQWQRRKRV